MNKKTAKEIYFDNFGNIMTMKRNGEYRDYAKEKIDTETEHKWSVDIKNHLLDDIVNKGELHKIVALSRINLPANEIIEAFKAISMHCSKDEVRKILEKLYTLLPHGIFEQIITLFL